MTASLQATLVLHSGKVATINPSDEIVDALAVDGDRILKVGSNDTIKNLIGPATKVIDLEGKVALPGLIDGHAHMDREGLKDVLPSLSGAKSIDDILKSLKSR